MNQESSAAALTVLDISRGFSIIEVSGKPIYFKHPSNVNFLKSEEFYNQRYQKAVKRGIQTEEQLLNTYIKRGIWSTQKEERIESLQWTISKSHAALVKITDDTQRTVFQNSISGQEKELEQLKRERNKLIGQSAEVWASQQRLIKMAQDHLFKDKNLTKHIDLDNDVSFIIALQKKTSELSNKHRLLAAVYEPSFFDVFSLQYRDPMSVFGRNFFDITIFQRYLLSYASVVLNKLKNVEMPDEVRQDPIKVYDFNANSKEKEGKTTHGVDDLKSTLRQKGKLTPEDLLQ